MSDPGLRAPYAEALLYAVVFVAITAAFFVAGICVGSRMTFGKPRKRAHEVEAGLRARATGRIRNDAEHATANRHGHGNGYGDNDDDDGGDNAQLLQLAHMLVHRKQQRRSTLQKAHKSPPVSRSVSEDEDQRVRGMRGPRRPPAAAMPFHGRETADNCGEASETLSSASLADGDDDDGDDDDGDVDDGGLSAILDALTQTQPSAVRAAAAARRKSPGKRPKQYALSGELPAHILQGMLHARRRPR